MGLGGWGSPCGTLLQAGGFWGGPGGLEAVGAGKVRPPAAPGLAHPDAIPCLQNISSASLQVSRGSVTSASRAGRTLGRLLGPQTGVPVPRPRDTIQPLALISGQTCLWGFSPPSPQGAPARSRRQRSPLPAPAAARAGKQWRRLQVTALCQRHRREVSVPGHCGCVLLPPAWRVLRTPPQKKSLVQGNGASPGSRRRGEHPTITWKNTSVARVG